MAKIIEIGNIDTTQYVNVTEGQNVGGTKTFTDSPVVPNPTANTQSANKKYVDDTTATKSELVRQAIPVSLSQLTNDKKFIDNTVDNLVNYYKKSEVYSQAEINELLGKISSLRVEIITDFPSKPDSSTIYLKTRDKSEEENIYDEYMYINNKWEKIGSTKTDLSNYYTIAQVDSKISEVTAAYKKAVEDLDTYVKTYYVKNFGNEQIEGIKTFISSPIVPSPSKDNEAATKKYVDDGVASFKIPENLVPADNRYSSDKVKIVVSESKPSDEAGYITMWLDPSADATNEDYVSVDEMNAAITAGTSNCVKTSGTQTIAGVKTFSSIPVLPSTNPTSNTQAATKGYVDNQTNKLVGQAIANGTVEMLEVTGLDIERDGGVYDIVIAEYSPNGDSTGHSVQVNGILGGKYSLTLNEMLSDGTQRVVTTRRDGIALANGYGQGANLFFTTGVLTWFNKDWSSFHAMSTAANYTGDVKVSVQQFGSACGMDLTNITSIQVRSNGTKIGNGSFIKVYKR